MADKITEIYDAVSTAYDAKYCQPIHIVEDEIVSRLVRSISQPNKRVLEIGCGTGHVVTLADLKAENYYGVDVSAASLKEAQRKYPDHSFAVADATTMPVKTIFDTVLFIYGQVNYIGLQATTEIIKNHCHYEGKYLSILYCGNGHPDYEYTSSLQSYFKPSEIQNAFAHLNGTVRGFSFYDIGANFEQQMFETINCPITDGSEYGCKYLIVSNLDELSDG